MKVKKIPQVTFAPDYFIARLMIKLAQILHWFVIKFHFNSTCSKQLIPYVTASFLPMAILDQFICFFEWMMIGMAKIASLNLNKVQH